MDTRVQTGDHQAFNAAVERLVRIAQAAETVALRSVSKVRTMFLIGLLASVWLTYFVQRALDAGPWTALLVFVVLALPPLLLFKLYRALHEIVGLPQRLRETIAQVKGKTAEFQQRFRAQAPAPGEVRGRFSDLLRLGRTALEVKSFGDEAQDILAVFGSALAVANPLFLVVMAGATAVTLVLLLAALGTGLVYLLS
ncbi:MAG TPA: hypothetical protein VFR86_02520 [Burkholderiaceae bacterium]|nr:hypothetical protein [Burkholderiaceae bacterium]